MVGYETITYGSTVMYVITDQNRRWEIRASIEYQGMTNQHKAIAAGKAIDNALRKDKPKFLVDQWLKWFDKDYKYLIL